jgi:hypothetical protein
MVRYESRAEESSPWLSTESQRQPAQPERGSVRDGKVHCGSQPANISLIHRRSSRPVPPPRGRMSFEMFDDGDHVSWGCG